jgi:hypothetical protein
MGVLLGWETVRGSHKCEIYEVPRGGLCISLNFLEISIHISDIVASSRRIRNNHHNFCITLAVIFYCNQYAFVG